MTPAGKPPRRSHFGTPYDPKMVERIGYRHHFFDDAYHFLLTSGWLRLGLLFSLVFIGVNLLFGEAYLFREGSLAGARPGSRIDAFFFSVQTISTVGYGAMVPTGLYANVVATLEAFVGLLGFAMVAGLVFAKVSRPTARVAFSHLAVMGRWDGKPALLIRMANARHNQVLDARVQLHMLRDELDESGGLLRRYHDLPLVRDRTPSFSLTWTAVHPIDERSPLAGLNPETLAGCNALLMVSIVGVDESFMQEIHARRVYQASEVAWNVRYADVLSRTGSGRLRLDYNLLHQVEPLEPARPADPPPTAAQPAP